MFSGVVAVVSLIVLVLPGFIASRVATGRRAQPTSITDLELVLRALFYALLVHAVLLTIGWTPDLVDRLETDPDWSSYRFDLICFGAALVALAVLFGWGIGASLRWLERSAILRGGKYGALASTTFHALGGQEARDAFDYVLERRRGRDEAFIVIVRVEESGTPSGALRAGVFGRESYFGSSPRPHDLHLEEAWDVPRGDRRTLVRAQPPHEAWYPASEIKDLWFRSITSEELQRGEVAAFAKRSIADALARIRRDAAAELFSAAAELPSATVAELRAAAAQTVDERRAIAGTDDYYEAMEWEAALERVGVLAIHLLIAASGDRSPRLVEQELADYVRYVEQQHDWELWCLMLTYYVEQLDPAGRDRLRLKDIAAHVVIAIMRLHDLSPADFGVEEDD